MTTFTLQIHFEPSDLELIRLAGQQVALVRSLVVQEPANVVWLAFSPFADNAVSWTEAYGLYAAQSAIVERQLIKPVTGVAAQPGALHTLNELGGFDDPLRDPAFGPGQYALRNRFAGRDHMALGMQLAAVVNDEPVAASPINAVIALRSQTAIFEPRDAVTVFLAAPIERSQVLGAIRDDTRTVFGRPHRLSFDPQNPHLCIKYRDGAFSACPRGRFAANTRTRSRKEIAMTDSFPSLRVQDLRAAIDDAQPVTGSPRLANLYYGEIAGQRLVLVHDREGTEVVERGLTADGESYLETFEEAAGDGPNARTLARLPDRVNDLPEVQRRLREEILPEVASSGADEVYMLCRGHWLPDDLEREDQTLWLAVIRSAQGLGLAILDATSGEVLGQQVVPNPGPLARTRAAASDSLVFIEAKMLVLAGIFIAAFFNFFLIFAALAMLIAILIEIHNEARKVLNKRVLTELAKLLKDARALNEKGRAAQRAGNTAEARKSYEEAIDKTEKAISIYAEHGVIQPALEDRLLEFVRQLREALEDLGSDDRRNGGGGRALAAGLEFKALAFEVAEFLPQGGWKREQPSNGLFTYTALADEPILGVVALPGATPLPPFKLKKGDIVHIAGNVVHFPPRS